MTKRKGVEIRVESNVPRLLQQTEQSVGRKLVAMGNATREKLLLEVLVGTRTGRQYTVPRTKTKYRASKPGEPPASRTGDLRRSYRVGKVEGAGLNKHIKVGSPLRYAPHLEEGTSRMAERPHLEPAVKLSKPEHEQILRGDWGI